MRGNFDSIINEMRPVIVDFHALWCGPCKVQSPILADIAKMFGEKVRVIKIDVDKNPMLASRFQIQGVPTVIIFKAGKILFRQSGVVSKGQLQSLLQQHL